MEEELRQELGHVINILVMIHHIFVIQRLNLIVHHVMNVDVVVVQQQHGEAGANGAIVQHNVMEVLKQELEVEQNILITIIATVDLIVIHKTKLVTHEVAAIVQLHHVAVVLGVVALQHVDGMEHKVVAKRVQIIQIITDNNVVAHIVLVVDHKHVIDLDVV